MAGREVVIYTTMYCPYCVRAKALLEGKGVEFREIPVDGDRAARLAMATRAGRRHNGSPNLHRRPPYRWQRRPSCPGQRRRVGRPPA